jgi:3-oxoacyl-[acyl-carrier protein] reductase
MKTNHLSGKIALVTGSSRGIGAAIARRLAADGAAVLVHYGSGRERAEAVVGEIKTAGGEAEAAGADLAGAAGPARLIEHLDAAFGGRFAGRLDILVNNAGTAEFGSLSEATDEHFDKQFNLNVRAVFRLSREAARRMTRAGWGRIINIGSCLGERVPMPGMAVYCATKFAINGLTRGWSRDLGPTGVTVNSVQPGPTDTEMNPANGPMAETQKKLTSVGRYGNPEEIANAVAFLARTESSFINGENLTVDGGWNA